MGKWSDVFSQKKTTDSCMYTLDSEGLFRQKRLTVYLPFKVRW